MTGAGAMWRVPRAAATLGGRAALSGQWVECSARGRRADAPERACAGAAGGAPGAKPEVGAAAAASAGCTAACSGGCAAKTGAGMGGCGMIVGGTGAARGTPAAPGSSNSSASSSLSVSCGEEKFALSNLVTGKQRLLAHEWGTAAHYHPSCRSLVGDLPQHREDLLHWLLVLVLGLWVGLAEGAVRVTIGA